MTSFDVAYATLEIARLVPTYHNLMENLKAAQANVIQYQKDERQLSGKIIELQQAINWQNTRDRYYASGGIHPCYD